MPLSTLPSRAAVRDRRARRRDGGPRRLDDGAVRVPLARRAEGGRVQGRLRIPANKREGLSERVMFLLQAIVKQRGPAAQP